MRQAISAAFACLTLPLVSAWHASRGTPAPETVTTWRRLRKCRRLIRAARFAMDRGELAKAKRCMDRADAIMAAVPQLEHLASNGRERRDRLVMRDGPHCAWCGRLTYERDGEPAPDARTADHIIPKCRGGITRDENLQLACLGCNNDRNGLSMEEYRAVLAVRKRERVNRAKVPK